LSGDVNPPGSTTVQVADHLLRKGGYSLTLAFADGAGDQLVETIVETKGVVSVNMVVHDGTHDEFLAAVESTQGPMNGGLVDVVFDNGKLTSATTETLINGKTTERQFP
jgi:hypothetical protein